MASLAKWFGHGPAAGADWSADTIKIALLDGTFAPDQDAQQFFADVSAHEVSLEGGEVGYVAGGVALSNKTKVYDAPTNTVTLSCDPISWANASFTTRYAVIYKDTGNPATSPLLGYIDFGASQTVGGSTFLITPPAGGLFTINAA